MKAGASVLAWGIRQARLRKVRSSRDGNKTYVREKLSEMKNNSKLLAAVYRGAKIASFMMNSN